jgi:predicted transcriptional regulator
LRNYKIKIIIHLKTCTNKETFGEIGMNNYDKSLPHNAERILKFIHQGPACHLRQIRKELDISMGTVQYHLNNLEKRGKIVSVRNGFYKYYFPAGVFQTKEKNLLQILSQVTARDILLSIVEKSNPSQSDIVREIGISHAAVNWHISRLLELNIIAEYRDRKFKRYRLNLESKYLMALMKNYYPNIWNILTSRVGETFLGLSRNEEQV